MEEAPKARKKEIMRVTLLGSFANFVLLVFKFVAGIWGHSSAMIADAVHSLSDFVTDIIVLLFVNISSKPKDESHDYGHGKYETLATSIVGIVFFDFEGIDRSGSLFDQRQYGLLSGGKKQDL